MKSKNISPRIDSKLMPPHTLREPSKEHPRTATEVWEEFMAWKQSVADYLHEQEGKTIDKSEADQIIDRRFCLYRKASESAQER